MTFSSSQTQAQILYTLTDEAPALASQSLLPIIKAFTHTAHIHIKTKDISLSARILSNFSDQLTKQQQIPDALQELAQEVKQPTANIIKLPNISASIPQLKAAIEELQTQGYKIPDYPDSPTNSTEEKIKIQYDTIKGSAVNPILREGNSDRRAPKAVKQYAKNHPHSMGLWQSDSKTHVASMDHGDFYGSEHSLTIKKNSEFKIELLSDTGQTHLLKEYAPLLTGEIIDSAVMSRQALRHFFAEQMKEAKDKKLLLSLHLKATMMKVSDPIIFGHAVSIYFQPVFEKYQAIFNQLHINANNGLGYLYDKISSLPKKQQQAINADIQACYHDQPKLAMVNSEQGISNFHVPSDIIIDASMPATIRTSGKMWGDDGKLHDTKALIPDRCYAGIYQETIDFCKQQGAFDPTTMGTVQNIGLMAQKAEEYGSHDKTFEIPYTGKVRVTDKENTILLEQPVEQGDIWRMCQVKQAAIKDWVKLAVHRARITQLPTIFWLDKQRAHDAQLITQVEYFLTEYDISNTDIQIMSPQKAINLSLQRLKSGLDTISVTGNVLRDYLTDLFPILELGTSAKMLSIVPLMAGGGLFETGAGGSAPKHVQQFLTENHLRWDSLGEFLALTVSLEHIAHHATEPQFKNKIQILAKTLEYAVTQILQNNQSPSRQVNHLDNRGSHFYLALYWAQALVEQSKDPQLKTIFLPIAKQLTENQHIILNELNSVQGNQLNLKGYYHPDIELVKQFMCPSQTFNQILKQLH
jgi:isocitrate dehydrogenase